MVKTDTEKRVTQTKAVKVQMTTLLRIVLSFSLVVAMMGVGGCTSLFGKPGSLQKKFEDYLYEKYGIQAGVDYEILGVGGSSFYRPSDQLRAYRIGGDEDYDRFIAEGSKQDDGSYVFRDNYFYILIKDDAIAYVEQMASKYYDKAVVSYWNSSMIPITFDSVKIETFDDFLRVSKDTDTVFGSFRLFVAKDFADEEEFIHATEQFCAEMKSAGLRSISIYWVEPEDLERDDVLGYFQEAFRNADTAPDSYIAEYYFTRKD